MAAIVVVIVLGLTGSVTAQYGLTDSLPDWRSFRPAAVKIPRMYDGQPSESTGVFPDVLTSLADRANFTLAKTMYFDTLQQAKEAVKSGKADILAVDLERDGIYKHELSFTEPLYASEVVFVKLKSTKEITRISLLDTTDLKDTVHAQPENYPGIYCKLVYSNRWRNDTEEELKRIKMDNVTFMGRNPLVESVLKTLPPSVQNDLEIVSMSPRRITYPSFGLSNSNNSNIKSLKPALDNGIRDMIASNDMGGIIEDNLPESNYQPPPTTTTSTTTTTTKKTTQPTKPTTTTDSAPFAQLVTDNTYDEMLANADKEIAKLNAMRESSGSYSSYTYNKTTTYNNKTTSNSWSSGKVVNY
ncbi:uncharacterized protein LOC129593755 [Paramacrobiotus metropolitanus]|uniref:uncharacterized protein LOC129593755 n=1 Tax=Paramacrobiotus metropolitanus TaxID=2943436 RepID=UPI002445ABC2|nr:uncharacterized protein LOC129593755 [Paramacrobiotus metropolitanus]